MELLVYCRLFLVLLFMTDLMVASDTLCGLLVYGCICSLLFACLGFGCICVPAFLCILYWILIVGFMVWILLIDCVLMTDVCVCVYGFL